MSLNSNDTFTHMDKNIEKQTFKAVETAKAHAKSVRSNLQALSKETDQDRRTIDRQLITEHTNAKLAILAGSIGAKELKPPAYETMDESVA